MNVQFVRPGLKLRADGSFTCLSPGEIVVVEADEEGYLFVPCAEGGHWLGGQTESDGTLIGFTPA